jgi:hypothetical protein
MNPPQAQGVRPDRPGRATSPFPGTHLSLLVEHHEVRRQLGRPFQH